MKTKPIEIEPSFDERVARRVFDAKVERLRAQNSTPRRITWVLRQSGAPLRSVGTPFDPEQVPEGVIERLDRWAEVAFTGASMILSGPVGSGKTMAAVYAMGEAYRHAAHVVADYDAGQEPQWSAPTLLFVKANALYAAVFRQGRYPDTSEGVGCLLQAREVGLLVIDDFGAPYDTEWPMAEMDHLIDRRYDAMLPTVLTTNLHPTDGSKTLLKEWPRVVSRLSQLPGPGAVVMDQKDQRKT